MFLNFLYAKDSSLLDLNGTKIFIFGKGLNEGVISNEFMEMMIPKDFIPICDINTDFPVFVGNYFKLQTKEEKKLFFKDGKEENWRAAHRVSMGSEGAKYPWHLFIRFEVGLSQGFTDKDGALEKNMK